MHRARCPARCESVKGVKKKSPLEHSALSPPFLSRSRAGRTRRAFSRPWGSEQRPGGRGKDQPRCPVLASQPFRPRSSSATLEVTHGRFFFFYSHPGKPIMMRPSCCQCCQSPGSPQDGVGVRERGRQSTATPAGRAWNSTEAPHAPAARAVDPRLSVSSWTALCLQDALRHCLSGADGDGPGHLASLPLVTRASLCFSSDPGPDGENAAQPD